MKKILNLSNHGLTQEQITELKGYEYEIVELSAEDKQRWANLNPDNYEDVVYRIIEDSDTRYDVDCFHIAGFPPAVVLAVNTAFHLGKRSVYAYSERVSEESLQPDGSVKKINVFKHLGFFNY